MDKNAIGIVELTSVAAGFRVSDAMLKAANVELLVARTICSGKYVSIVGGDIAEVASAVDVGKATGDAAVIDTCVLANLDASIFPAVTGTSYTEVNEALGVLESFSVAALIEAADAAVKAASVDLVEIRLAMALGGKAFATLTGQVSAVQAAVDAGAAVLTARGLLVNTAVIAAPRPEIVREVV
ncbi:MAG: propanediol utilization protein [Armatimonadetes bacterium CG_4_10_14_3_um_filter_66_18]|nr:BMC domain-containing protein [Armatimonadota bacterium]PIU92715.1 MAG: propanediol utilization protein [Armatimonadetes bacterium CG06_land_8_20_14_3_00_66_21]PIX45163.1 MAG: propanediol utilization protein [Armatimonadetes bacterium CG_4_8_14_3_um_filter_66_20]PIY38129.1 MAG: propanediol utilization protein [Armatimonadetes bacterium CG_4_10_14_3_um_filter_66_18]PIZ47882.1 MAG: propanediol utilization protein [Armatimonadetes bacterium CG_4_10_14_0_8_um_filter_66_14]PJB70721.1 MAG: propan